MKKIRATAGTIMALIFVDINAFAAELKDQNIYMKPMPVSLKARPDRIVPSREILTNRNYITPRRSVRVMVEPVAGQNDAMRTANRERVVIFNEVSNSDILLYEPSDTRTTIRNHYKD